MSFVHLHTHSHYSLLNGVPKIKPLVKAAKEDGMTALALTDNGNLYGAIEFYQACKKEGIKPILGVDFYVAARGRADQDPDLDGRRSRLVLLAENETGYKNLIKLITTSYTEGFYIKPRVDREVLAQWSEGLIAILPSFWGEHMQALRGGDLEHASEVVHWYTDTYGKNSVFLELSHHAEIEGRPYLEEKIVELAKQTAVPLVAAQDTFYLNPEDREARETLIKIQTGGTVEDEGYLEDEDFSFITQARADELFRETPDALENTLRIAERCTLEIELGHWYFPDYRIDSGREPDEELTHLAQKGVTWRGLTYEGKVKERLDYELEVIKMKGYSKYFLAVGDLLREARERKILTTIRGSVAGSLTTYVLGITTVNPLDYTIPFERFLNPLRPSAPDIDMDYADNRRDEIIDYAREKYGVDKVAQIGTFGTMMARAAVRDVARALGYGYGVGDRIAKLIPIGSQGFPMTIDTALEVEKEFAELVKKDKDTARIVALAKKIEGSARHVGVHAAGVVIAPEPLSNFVPLQPDPKGGKLITQYDMHAVGEDGVGLLKFDFLGIKNLSILADARDRVKERYGVEVDFDTIPLNDEKTFAMLTRGDTMGVFQLGGAAMTRYLKELKPSTIHDINAMIALYRPGPMRNIPEYIARKQGRSQVRYFHPKAKEWLEPSYGILVYQEDLLFTALELAGYDWESVDKFRKAVGKKIPEEMAKQHIIFVNGCQEHSGMTKEEAEAIWNLFEPFQGYGFNKAHAASYGRVAYQTAYMKANYPVEYMAAILTADSGDIDKVGEAVNECKRIGIRVLKPDINESFSDFTVVKDKDTPDKDAIRFGLRSIKNFGEGITDTIIAEREAHGRFVSIADFLERVKSRNLNKKSLEALIMCGALDSFHIKRGRLLAHIDRLLDYAKEHAVDTGQTSLFGGLSKAGEEIQLPDAPEAERSLMLTWEKELIGLYVSGHPLDEHREKLARLGRTITDTKEGYPGVECVMAGLLTEVKPLITKKGDKMAFIKLVDYDGFIEGVVFPKTYQEVRERLLVGTCVALKGKVNERNGERSFVLDKVKPL